MIGEDYIFIDPPKNATSSIVWVLDKEIGGGEPKHNHIPALSYLQILRDEYHKKFKFSVVRNPYDRLVSYWEYYNKLKTSWWEKNHDTPTPENDEHRLMALKFLEHVKTFPAFVNHIHSTFLSHFMGGVQSDPLIQIRRSQWQHLPFPLGDVVFKSQCNMLMTLEGVCDMDYLIRFESINEGWREVCEKMGWGNIELPHRNKTERKPWEEYYDADLREKTYEFYRPDFLYFGYDK